MKKHILVSAVIVIIVKSLSWSVQAQQKGIEKQKRYYSVSSELHSYELIVWLSDDVLALQVADDTRIGAWYQWQSTNPTFYQIFQAHNYRIEFERVDTLSQQKLFRQIKFLIENDSLKDSVKVGDSLVTLLETMTSDSIHKQISEWDNYKTFDYADIGDNEADPVLSKLIHQGFFRQL